MFKIVAHSQDIVQYDKRVGKDIDKLPIYVAEKLRFWANLVNSYGIAEARKGKSFHDEPLKGDRKGQRSVRLSKAYRAIYIEDKKIIRITVIEVNKHEY